MKTVGKPQPRALGSPADLLRRAERIIIEANRLAPIAKPRGFVVKFKTRHDYAAWRASQTNPRFW